MGAVLGGYMCVCVLVCLAIATKGECVALTELQPGWRMWLMGVLAEKKEMNPAISVCVRAVEWL